MKHTLFTILTLMAFAIGAMAEEVVVLTKDGKRFSGELRTRTDSTLTIYNRNNLKYTTFNSEEIAEATTAQGGRFTVENGKIVGHSYDEIMARKYAEEKKRMGDPNYAIGKAMKVTGGVSLGVGVPALVVGTILVASGQSDLNKLKKTSINVNNIKDKESLAKELKNRESQMIEAQNCVTAGLVLMPFGGALTIAGIPLYVHGKRIMSLSLQVSENGPGVAVNF